MNGVQSENPPIRFMRRVSDERGSRMGSTRSTGSRRAIALTVATIAAIGLLAGCSSAEEQATENAASDATAPSRGEINEKVDDGPGTPGGTLAYGLSGETDGWNPTLSRWSSSGLIVARTFFDPLAVYDENLGWKPFLAESFVPNEDATQWVMTLRPDVTFHNGNPVDATAVAAFLNYAMASPLTGKAFEQVEEIRADGELTVVFDLKVAWRNMPYAFTNQIGYVADPTWLDGGDPEKPVGSGPFKVDEWVRDNKMEVSRYGDYWQEGQPLLDGIEFQPIPDEITRTAALESGTVDVIQVSTGDQLKSLRSQAAAGEIQIVTNDGGETPEQFVMLNTKASPLDDPVARRALVMATDSQSFVDIATRGQYDVARGPFPETSQWYAETDYPSYDLEAAKALVDEVKASHGGEFTFEIVTTSAPGAAEAVAQLQSQWNEAGIDVTVRTTDITTLIRDVVFGQYQSTYWAQFDSPHPLSDTIWWAPWAAPDPPDPGLNFARNENAAIGDAINAAAAAQTRDEEIVQYGLIQQELAKDLPYVWLYHSVSTLAASNDVVNLVRWKTPEGDVGLEIASGAHPLSQTWLRR